MMVSEHTPYTGSLGLISSPSAKEISLDEFSNIVIKYMKRIIEDNENRMNGYKTNSILINKGIYYPNEYYKIIKNLADHKRKERVNNPNLTKEQLAELSPEEKRLNWLVEHGSFFHGIVPKCFSINKNILSETGYAPINYQLNKGEKPSTALNSLISGLTFIGCAEVIQVAEYSALLEVLGEEKFNTIFSAEGKTPLTTGGSVKCDPPAPCDCFLDRDEQSQSFKKGQFVFFPNIPEYTEKHLDGEAAGWNTICIEDGDNPKFIGFGFSKDGVLLKRINQAFYDEYNKAPIGDGILPIPLRNRVKSSLGQMKAKEFYEKLKEHPPQKFKFRISLVNKLIKAPLQEAGDLLAKWTEKLPVLAY